MSFEIRVNSQPFNLWETAKVKRSIDTNSGVFRFTSTATEGQRGYPVKAGDAVQVIIDGAPVVTGFVDKVTVAHNTQRHTITVMGRDNTQDLIDSTVPDSVKSLSGELTMPQLCEQMINALGASIPVVNSTGLSSLQFPKDTQFTSDSGRTIMSFLVDFARKLQIYLITDGAGRLVLFRPGTTRAVTPLQHKGLASDNVKEYTASFDHQNRFNRYITRTQANFSADDEADYSQEAATNTEGGSTDDQVRASRIFELQTEESMDTEQTGNRAEEEANIRRALSSSYGATVQGSTQQNGQLWDIGQLVKVDDEFAEMRGTFLIKSVEYSLKNKGGTISKLLCVPPDAYTARGEPTSTDARRTSTGDGFQTSDAPTGGGFTR